MFNQVDSGAQIFDIPRDSMIPDVSELDVINIDGVELESARISDPVSLERLRAGMSRAEVVRRLVADYVDLVRRHPIARMCLQKRLTREVLELFARAQKVDNDLWIVPMLVRARDMIRSPKLYRAVSMNINEELGSPRLGGVEMLSAADPEKKVSHVDLVYRFISSLGLDTGANHPLEYSPASAHAVGLMMNLTGARREALMAGWLDAQEHVVPEYFRYFAEAYPEGVDVTYLTEHVDADSPEGGHANWMREGVEEILEDVESLPDVIDGVHLGGRAALSVLDWLYSKAVGQQVQA